ncbi:hypothetical protein PIB30_079585 [Stylosanthes scabra]|uniref:Uncharacterized protein n=1 Tax=Stylosanthes scabra TaxID=79078 RepID=A0ABU6TQR3_9FABA|nr:hypothetical protein [Stylosanthes scabra]
MNKGHGSAECVKRRKEILPSPNRVAKGSKCSKIHAFHSVQLCLSRTTVSWIWSSKSSRASKVLTAVHHHRLRKANHLPSNPKLPPTATSTNRSPHQHNNNNKSHGHDEKQGDEELGIEHHIDVAEGARNDDKMTMKTPAMRSGYQRGCTRERERMLRTPKEVGDGKERKQSVGWYVGS